MIGYSHSYHDDTQDEQHMHILLHCTHPCVLSLRSTYLFPPKSTHDVSTFLSQVQLCNLRDPHGKSCKNAVWSLCNLIASEQQCAFASLCPVARYHKEKDFAG